MRFLELREKEVINCKDCKRLGCVADIEFDPCSGCIKKIYVSNKCRWLPNLLSEPECSICFKDICQFGPDIIIVEV